MITDDQLIDRVRTSMRSATTDVYVPPGLLDGIAPSGRRRPRVPSAGGLFSGLAAVTAVVVAAVAIVLLGHGRTPNIPAVAPPTAGPTTLIELRTELSVLRRPQRATDRLPAWGVAAEQRVNCSNCLNVSKLLARQSRLVTTIELPATDRADGRGARVYLVLGTVARAWQHGLASGWHQGEKAGRGLHLSLVGLTTKRSREAQPTDVLLNYAGLPMPAPALTPRDVLITSRASVGLVPDGVTRVKWELANPGQTSPVAVFPRVRGNVATAPWTPAPRYTSLINEQLLVGATWYGPDGRVIARFSVSMAEINRAYGPKPGLR